MGRCTGWNGKADRKGTLWPVNKQPGTPQSVAWHPAPGCVRLTSAEQTWQKCLDAHKFQGIGSYWFHRPCKIAWTTGPGTGQNGQIRILIKMENTTQSLGAAFSLGYCCCLTPWCARTRLGSRSVVLTCTPLSSGYLPHHSRTPLYSKGLTCVRTTWMASVPRRQKSS